MPRTQGRIHRDGLTGTATVLVAALEAAQTDTETAETLSHPFHTYPARLHPATAKVLVEFAGDGTILDPFCGSGTVLVEARAAGQRAIGSDLNPLAVLVARAKTWTVPPRRRRELVDAGHAIAAATLAAGKA